MSYKNIREEELKLHVAQDFFPNYDCKRRIGNIDFCVTINNTQESLYEFQSLVWAESKKGVSNLYQSITQLILTIGKARTFDTYLPPQLLCAFDSEKIGFIEYNQISFLFYITDFNWNVTPSDYSTREFNLVLNEVKKILDKEATIYFFEKDPSQLREFIKNNLIEGKTELSKIQIDKNNFMVIYNKWVEQVKPTIAIPWDTAQDNEIIDADFYLADILSEDNLSFKDKLYITLNHDRYILDKKLDNMGLFSSKEVKFKDGQKTHTQFWNRYVRPPQKEYWDYIVDRRDLLVPQDIREIKGSYYTPYKWVELSQKYLADVLGKHWQDEYYIWDCAAGTGNLLLGLTNKYNIFASTLDKQDVDIMHDRIDNGANLLKNHVFQFDFLNDEFSKLPLELQKIINDSEKRKKLVIYINPPYAEATNAKTQRDTGKNRAGLSDTLIFNKYKDAIGLGIRELFAQFIIRIYKEIPNSIIAQFSTLKHVQSSNFASFREVFLAELLAMFLVPADTFDNVKGKFPIGFFIWDTSKKTKFNSINSNYYNKDSKFEGIKHIFSYKNNSYIIQWLRNYYDKENDKERVAYLRMLGTDMQHNKDIFISNDLSENDFKKHLYTIITKNNLPQMSIYFSVRQMFDVNWLNNRDQFLYPNNLWEDDIDFINDCIAISLFDSQNKISSKLGINHWIPFNEYDVDSKGKFESNFMTQYIAGKIKADENLDLYTETIENKPIIFTSYAKDVFLSGKELWKYYHSKPNVDINASLYDIKEYFQGRNEIGRMNAKSDDLIYMELISDLKEKLSILVTYNIPKVYEYGFLKR